MEYNDYRVRFTKRAESDLYEIDDYISNELNASIAAERFTDALERAIGTLSFSPQGFPKVRDDRLAARGYRWIGVKNYMAFYTIDEQNKIVNVERILYGRRDWQRLL